MDGEGVVHGSLLSLLEESFDRRWLHRLRHPAREVPDLLVAVPASVQRIVRPVVPPQLNALPDQPLGSPRRPHGFNYTGSKSVPLCYNFAGIKLSNTKQHAFAAVPYSTLQGRLRAVRISESLEKGGAARAAPPELGARATLQA